MSDVPHAALAAARMPDVRMAYWWAAPGERSSSTAPPRHHPLFELLDAVRHELEHALVAAYDGWH